MNFQPIFEKKDRPVFIAGPCSAETEEQVMNAAWALADKEIDLFRLGIWKPRTRPNSFEGIGEVGLPWLERVKKETGLRVTVEVARKEHVFEALRHGVDVLWIGARTTVNPFSVQEIADALQGVDVPVMVKNPINPDLNLWIGALERIYKVGIKRIAAIHRGFSYYGDTPYRNVPRWQIPIELKRQFPDLEVICDHSHICGRRDLLQGVAQQALDLNFDGLMTEVHPDPDTAWSDALQQLTPKAYAEMRRRLIVRKPTTDNKAFLENLDNLRHQIDEIDEELIQLLARRMRISGKIGAYKRANNISILQPKRWDDIILTADQLGGAAQLSQRFVHKVFRAIHQESINIQARIMNEDLGAESDFSSR